MTTEEKRKTYKDAQNRIVPVLIRMATEGKSVNNDDHYRHLFKEYQRLARLLSYL